MFNLERFREIVEEQGRKTIWLAEVSGLKPFTMGAILRGDRNPSLPVIKNLARALKVPESELTGSEIHDALPTQKVGGHT